MKVLFVPHYIYLHAESFCRVISRLNMMGCTAVMVVSSDSHGIEQSEYSKEQLQTRGCRIREESLPWLGWTGLGTLARLRQTPSLLNCRARIRGLLREERPDIVVVGSDLGRFHIRVLLDECERQRIAVLILTTASVAYGPTDNGNESRRGVRWPVRLSLRLLSLQRPALFDGSVIGTFAHSAKIAVPGEMCKARLQEQGIEEERVFVTGDPGYDRLFEMRNEPENDFRSAILARSRWPEESKLVMYCTEVIHEVYGYDYLETINVALSAAFDSLPAEYRVVVKLHPRETDDTRRSFARHFSGGRYHTVVGGEVLPYLRSVELCVGHFSQVLMDAVLVGKPVVAINMQRDMQRSLFGEAAPLATVEDEAELKTRIFDILESPETRKQAQQQLAAWVERQCYALDGQNAARVARLIVNLIT